ncbi:type I-F CRISPR-associated endoribonuclease Cas6/Csy4 [Shewanella sp. AS1]|uniref:type I-F CRISPR-associated endoribonuclease Cas6/Csy4 n=1 Tax=Shewanella sp. AS1 TaxID=2907626 RepID=UPI001F3F5268|nr:type I-F CRISPR-associated endoribonuclease Cas6/Csy4 [Shewanella sp. AS1]MCE9680472.1 type I-F CRISPR-associated endoribonuclease Cas6/Csy4 [Shewanella sp. AS1]
MKYYLDITLLPSEDMGHHFLWEKLYHQVHLALVEHKNSQGQFVIGVAFPQFDGQVQRLGSKLRLLAQSEESLEQLAIDKWLARFRDYFHVTSVRPVPAQVESYVSYSRPKVRTGKDREIRRRMKRHNETLEQATAHFEGFETRTTKAPFVYAQSYSSGARFPLFIEEKVALGVGESAVTFDSYGLSSQGVLPKF